MSFRVFSFLLVHAIVATPTLAAHAEPPEATLAFVGDINFAGRAPAAAAKTHPFAAVRPILDAATFAIGNLEGLLLDTAAPAYGERRLDISADPAWAAALAESGLDALGVANNHTWDAGADGLREHLAHLAAAGLAVFGAGESAERARAPIRIASPVGPVVVIPASLKSNRRGRPGAAAAIYDARAEGLAPLLAQIRAERAAGAFVVVSIHWGREAVAEPPKGVVSAAHALVDAGADLVVGHHPHVLQGIEWRGGSAIAYSLGNFMFVNRDLDKRSAGILHAGLARGPDDRPRLTTLALTPTVTDLVTFAPALATPRDAERIAALLAARSRPWQTRIARAGNTLAIHAGTPRDGPAPGPD